MRRVDAAVTVSAAALQSKSLATTSMVTGVFLVVVEESFLR
jgi:hypothetical protein